jgi:hypothetical protein
MTRDLTTTGHLLIIMFFDARERETWIHLKRVRFLGL